MATAAIIVGVLLRFYDLSLAPLHHDEGVNGNFMLEMVREGSYRYDPSNYHGPTLYFLDLPFVRLLGTETFSLRLLPALFGVGLLLLLLSMRFISSRAAIMSTLLVAVSPGMVYFSRYFIHEMMVVLFTLGMIAPLIHPKLGSMAQRVTLAAASAGFLFATKETAAPTLCVLVMAVICTRVVHMVWQAEPAPMPFMEYALPEPAGARPATAGAGKAAAIFLGINVIFYSSYFKDFTGVRDALRALTFWSSTGTRDHLHPLGQYLLWMLREEGVILLLGLCGITLALTRRNNRTVTFCAFWALGVFSMYSIIPYKTPWLTINILLPFSIMAGYALDEGVRKLYPAAAAAMVGVAVLYGLIQCISLNFINYDNNRYAYVYAHTVRDVERLDRDVALLARGEKDGAITVVAGEYWPLPWLWRDRNALFYGKMVPLDGAPIVVSTVSQAEEVRRTGKGKLHQVGTYTLRPGVDLMVWTRKRA